MSTNQISKANKRPVPLGGFMLLSSNQWLVSLGVGFAAAALLWPAYEYISPWLGFAVFLLGNVLVHFRYSSRFIVPFPHMALLILSVQYILGAWLSWHYPSHDPLCNIGYRLPIYLEYATLVFAACIVGWAVGFAKIRPTTAVRIRASSDLLMELDVFILIGFVGVALGRISGQSSMSFVFILLGNLRYLGVFGRMLCKGPGWGWRLLLVFLAEMLFATGGGMFGNLIMWVLWAFALWVYLFTPAGWKLVAAFALALVLLPSLHESKWELRKKIWGKEEDQVQEDSMDKTGIWLSSLGSSFQKTITGNLDGEFIGDAVSRYNQGWIIDRVMQYIPEHSPYAEGETLKEALIATLLPRFIMPEKVIAGGKANMEKYAGLQLTEGTSMNLGYGGEMYANFGFWGGILGSGMYIFSFALLFRWIANRAFVSPLWWCVMPYVGFPAMKTEDGIVEVVNWTFKGGLVMIAVYCAFPAFRGALNQAGKRARRKRKGVDSVKCGRRESNRGVGTVKAEVFGYNATNVAAIETPLVESGGQIEASFKQG